MSYPPLYLKSPKSKPIPAMVNVSQQGPVIRLQVKAGHLEFELLALRDELLTLLTPPPVSRDSLVWVASGEQTGAQRNPLDVRSMTPLDVVTYFEQSPVLHIYAADVRTAVLSHSEGLQADYQLQQDLQATKHLINPSQADIAQALFDDRTKTGGAYRRRILAVLGATTTGFGSATAGSKVKKAA